MARKTIFKKTGLLNETVFKSATDTAFWLKILENYPVGILKEKLIRRRVGKSQGSYQFDYLYTERANQFFVIDSFSKSKSLEGIIIGKRILKKYENRQRTNNLHRARNLLMKGDILKSRKMLMKSFSGDVFVGAFVSIKELRSLLIRVVLLIGISFGVGKPLLKILYRLRQIILKYPKDRIPYC